AKTLAAIEERQRLARDLHDAISQTLFSVNLIAESLPRLLNHDPEKMRANLEKLRLLSRGAHAEMRIMLMELRSEHLLLGSIEEQFKYLAATLTGRQSITVSLKVALETESNSLPSDVHEAFYRITQEALSNISKHSKATHVDLQLIREDDAIKLLVQDNGKGFVVDEVTRSLGMSTMSERAANIGAAFELNSEPGKGTRIGVVWNPED
ncbi:MAG TPA: sensor histidine kinase, partial [Aggregatilineales bacterium]|nr:sensor histidine kinase [Aggregatilineales bacterium]